MQVECGHKPMHTHALRIRASPYQLKFGGELRTKQVLKYSSIGRAWHAADHAVRFLVGGVVVCAFAMIGEVVEPKSLAGVLGAAPSVAIATLSLTIWKEGRLYASQESRSMVADGLAFLILRLVLYGDFAENEMENTNDQRGDAYRLGNRGVGLLVLPFAIAMFMRFHIGALSKEKWNEVAVRFCSVVRLPWPPG
jgi:hypothetical protein